jgi:hypothetical protein
VSLHVSLVALDLVLVLAGMGLLRSCLVLVSLCLLLPGSSPSCRFWFGLGLLRSCILLVSFCLLFLGTSPSCRYVSCRLAFVMCC